MARGTAAIVDEVETHGSETDLECLTYVLDCVAGSSDVTFQHGWSRDAAPSHNGKRLADFVAHPRSRGAGLLEAHVVAQRLYTTAAFRSINTPLRKLATHPVTKEVVLPPKIVEPHPMPCTVTLLQMRTTQTRVAQTRVVQTPIAQTGVAQTRRFRVALGGMQLY